MEFSASDFLTALGESFARYKQSGPRSSQKLRPLHGYACPEQSSLCCCRPENALEIHRPKHDGASDQHCPKNIDVCVTRDNQPVFCLGNLEQHFEAGFRQLVKYTHLYKIQLL